MNLSLLRVVAPVLAWSLLFATSGAASETSLSDVNSMHENVMGADSLPSARECASCHPRQFEQWSRSQHAYAQLSPIFNAMQGALGKLTNGTLGDFCIRCHTPVGMSIGEPVFAANASRHSTSREGVTCVSCHRQSEEYGKLGARFALQRGDLTSPIYGPTGDNRALDEAIREGGLVTNSERPGRRVHAEVKPFFALSTSGFCATCHDLTGVDGIRLQEVFSEWKRSPAAERGIDCQDCHMGREPGKVMADPSAPDFDRKNYDFGPAALLGSLETPPRKLTDHRFPGPDYSVIHPALFPFNMEAIREEEPEDRSETGGLATISEWLAFDWRAGWGTDAFEDLEPDEDQFPERWADVDSRYEARELLVENLRALREMRDLRLRLLRNGYELGEVIEDEPDSESLGFRIRVRNITSAHSVPSGDDAERLVWLHVRVTDLDGKLVFESGDLDPNGDLRDSHSRYVHNRELALDDQLFNLQSKFLIRPLRGAEVDQIIPVPYGVRARPFLQKARSSSILQGQAGEARRHRKGIPTGAERWAAYEVPREQLTGRAPYRVSVKLKAAMVPVHLVNAIQIVGFDYGLSAREIAKTLVHGFVDEQGEVILWDPDSEDPDDNRVVGHQVLFERQAELGRRTDGPQYASE